MTIVDSVDVDALVADASAILDAAAAPFIYAARVALMRAAGGLVTNLVGEQWTPDSGSALAATLDVHAQILDILRAIGGPDEY